MRGKQKERKAESKIGGKSRKKEKKRLSEKRGKKQHELKIE